MSDEDRPAARVGGGARRLRADAEANLERVVLAAEEVFAEYGIEASIELVAQRAGVGLGTVYRRFTNKDALVAELVNRLLRDVVAVGERVLGSPDGSGLARYMREVCALLASQRGAVARLWNHPSSADLVARSRDVQRRLVEEARARRAVRDDLTAEDVAVALWSIHGILDVTRGVPVDAWRRHLEILLAGFADVVTPLTTPSLDPETMTAIIRRGGLPPGRPAGPAPGRGPR